MMKKAILFAAVCGLSLVGAAPPSTWSNGSGYPPCSRTVTDRCIQLYERGVATPANLALNEQLGPDRQNVGLAALEAQPEPMVQEDEFAMAPDEDELASNAYVDEQPIVEDWNGGEDELAANWSGFGDADSGSYGGGSR
jgi:hypothetical protein